MASHKYGLLDQAEEDSIHESRLLSVEIRPFSKVTSRLLQPNSILNKFPTHLPTPPPESEIIDEAEATKAAANKQEEEIAQWREECLLDFASFEASIIRIQLLQNSNEIQRAKYAEKKVGIQNEMQNVRDRTVEYRIKLDEARKTLALRKTYDDLADKILSNRMLKPREDQHVQLEKLNAEIAELEREKEQYAETWAERRHQFKKIVEEGQSLMRIVRDEKEEAERKEGMEGGDEADEAEAISKGETSNVGTPRPEGGSTPLHRRTDGDENTSQSQLGVPRTGHLPGSPARAASEAPSPMPRIEIGRGDTAKDEDMGSDGEIEEGEADDDAEAMDV